MLKIFTWLADWMTVSLFKMDPTSRLTQSVHFFIEDITKIFFLLITMIYLIAILRASMDTGKVRDFLQGKKRWVGYLLAAIFGAITPFCSCSSIPLFLGFTAAGIPLGITMAFLITSPMINEVAVVLLGSILGIKFTVVYIITGISAGVLGGFFIDLIKADRFLTPIGTKASQMAHSSGNTVKDTIQQGQSKIKLSIKERHQFAASELKTILKRIWIWIIAGVGLGAALHGFVPEEWIIENLHEGKIWSVPAAVLLGIPLYANAGGIIPVAESLMSKGLPVGTTMAFMMSTVGASFPEFMMLKQVMKPKLLIIFFSMFLVFFTLAGWLFNIIF